MTEQEGRMGEAEKMGEGREKGVKERHEYRGLP